MLNLTPEQITLVNRAKEIVNSDVVVGFSAGTIKQAANQPNPTQFTDYLKDIAQQASDPQSERQTIQAYGEELCNIAKTLYSTNNQIRENLKTKLLKYL
jgi:hypothetical protein